MVPILQFIFIMKIQIRRCLPQAMSGGMDAISSQSQPTSSSSLPGGPPSSSLIATMGGIASRELGRAYRGFVAVAGAAIRHRLSDAEELGDDESKWPQVKERGQGRGERRGEGRGEVKVKEKGGCFGGGGTG